MIARVLAARIVRRCVQDERGCLVWRGAKHPFGYGKIKHEGQTLYTHRTVLEAKLGRALRPGMHAGHECNNPSCCNARHLAEVTRSQNMRHMVKCGRGRGQFQPKEAA